MAVAIALIGSGSAVACSMRRPIRCEAPSAGGRRLRRNRHRPRRPEPRPGDLQRRPHRVHVRGGADRKGHRRGFTGRDVRAQRRHVRMQLPRRRTLRGLCIPARRRPLGATLLRRRPGRSRLGLSRPSRYRRVAVFGTYRDRVERTLATARPERASRPRGRSHPRRSCTPRADPTSSTTAIPRGTRSARLPRRRRHGAPCGSRRPFAELLRPRELRHRPRASRVQP